MTPREKILARVREALRCPAPQPGHSTPAQAAGSLPATLNPEPFRPWLPAVPADPGDRLALFRKHAVDLKADFHVLSNQQELPALLHRLRDTEQWKKIAAHRGKLTDLAISALALPLCRTDQPYDVQELESCSAGITECDALIAQTGSVLVTSRSAGGRALSVLPPHHLVLARRDQLVADLPEAFALLKTRYGSDYPSFISFITGPSRTGDIERILVLGAHGPKKLTIVCC
jgi:L-lactate dehydrogenase complex protein LldG